MESQSDLTWNHSQTSLSRPPGVGHSDYAPTWQWSPMRYLGASPTRLLHSTSLTQGTSLRSLGAALTPSLFPFVDIE